MSVLILTLLSLQIPNRFLISSSCHRRIYLFSSTRFLSIFKLLQGVLDKFKIVEKLVFISDELLNRFQPFLVSPPTKNCHIVFMQLSEIESPTKIARLANFFGLVSVDFLDEFAAAKLCMNGILSLGESFKKSLLQQWKSLGSLCEFVLLVCPHNMNAESGFSRMKFAESQHQSLAATISKTRSIFQLSYVTVRQAASEYKKSTESKVEEKFTEKRAC